MKYLKEFSRSKLFIPVLALVLLLIFDYFYIDGFFDIRMKDGHLFGSVIDILNRGAPLMLVSLGMTLVIATGGVDLSVGPIIAISGAVAAKLIGGSMVVQNGVVEYVPLVSLPVAIMAALVAAVIAGMWNGMLVGKLRIHPMVATLILMYAGRGIAQMITQGQIITIYYKPYYFIGIGYLFGLPFSIFILLFMIIFIKLLTRKTALGLYIESVGINANASYYVGINGQKIKFIVYVISGLCAGIAGLIISSNIKCADANNAGYLMELDAILSVMIGGHSFSGGRFNIFSSIVGALIVQTLTTTVYSVGVPPEVTLVVKAAAVITIIIMQSDIIKKRVFNTFL